VLGLLRELADCSARANAAADLTRYRKKERSWREESFSMLNSYNGPGLHPGLVMETVGRVFGRDAIYVADGGFTSLWAHFMLPPTRARSYLNILELGMLGIGIPASIGAKLGNPGREVVCVSGDGAAGFHCMELQSAVREGANVTVVVFSEGSWTMEVPNEQMRYGRTFGTEMGPIRWDRIAEGVGCSGFFVEAMSDLEPALRDARSSTRPALICVRTDRTANMSVPPSVGQRFGEVYNGPAV
jgi:acetolactate synthase-1/2/3 large subunit